MNVPFYICTAKSQKHLPRNALPSRRRLGLRQSLTPISLLESLTGGNQLTNLSGIMRQLKTERDRVQQQLSGLNAALAAFAGVYTNGNAPRRKISAKGRARIASAQRARWAKVKGQNASQPVKRTMSLSARFAKLRRPRKRVGLR